MATVHTTANNTVITTTAPNINSVIKPAATPLKPVNESLATSGRITDTISAIHKNKKVYKIIVVGDSSVGKTTLTYRFCEGKFLENIQSTIGVDFRSRTVSIDGEEITLQLWDTAGQEKYRMSMIRHYYRNVHAIVFVYDVTNAASFDSLGKWIEECDKHCSHEVPRILVGNKCDGVVAVTTNVAQRFADQHNLPLFETSARLDSQCDNVDAIFLTIAHKLKNCKQFIPRPATVEITVPDQHEPSKPTWYC